jgi:transposase InsO family protein
VVERFHRSRKYELLSNEIANAAELAEKVKEFPTTFNEVRPHETLGWRQPLEVHRADPHLLRGPTPQLP